jgi:predicted DNA-binding helix-hairpin-helix protein
MAQIKQSIHQAKDEKKHFRFAPAYVPGGQSTQMIIGATNDSDRSILMTASKLYKTFEMKRVYYSAYMAVNEDKLLPSVITAPPLQREHRLYQADFLMRFYKFQAEEILTEEESNFDLDYDPKMNWAFRHIDQFPMEINKVSYDDLLRIPGIGVTSAQRILKQRRLINVKFEDLKKMGVVVKRAKYFILCNGKFYGNNRFSVAEIKGELNPIPKYQQLALF